MEGGGNREEKNWKLYCARVPKWALAMGVVGCTDGGSFGGHVTSGMCGIWKCEPEVRVCDGVDLLGGAPGPRVLTRTLGAGARCCSEALVDRTEDI
jgi:hypothetical protein